MDTDKQISQMKQFILSEAKEKAEEIKTKAENEAYAWRNESSKRMKEDIDRQCQKELEGHKVEQRVQQANKLKAQRDRILAARTEAVDELRTSSCNKLKALTNDKSKYSAVFKDLIRQAADSLAAEGQQTNAVVRVRSADMSIAKDNLKVNSAVTLTVDSTPLADTVIGGVMIVAHGGRIVCNNTLQHRLENCMEEVMPILRNGLFTQ
eukprot:TRINITY_DN38136_c0_g1_i1.p2 TRINITY_DN38136_c0_g1~~TRINITY_DN38136_c0_g1_i1.p2  ORF type:complete len:235 (+),score=123.76 TRINITY_DN38136_c0_g1_i1:84-707(+)